jgi:hypothetical protein
MFILFCIRTPLFIAAISCVCEKVMSRTGCASGDVCSRASGHEVSAAESEVFSYVLTSEMTLRFPPEIKPQVEATPHVRDKGMQLSPASPVFL